MKDKIMNNKELIVAIAIVLIFLATCSYAWLKLQVIGNKTNILRAGTLKLTLDDTTSNGISLENAVPMSDEKGKTTTEYTFTLQNTGTTVGYTIYLDDVALTDGETQLEDSKVKYQLTKNGAETVALLSSLDNKVIDTGTIDKNKTNTYSLRVWIDSDAGNEVMGKILSKELRVEAVQTKQTTPTVVLKAGDYVKMTPTSTSYTISASSTGYSSDQTINPSELNLWRVIKVNNDGTIDLVSEYVSSTGIHFSGKLGYQNYIATLNQIASKYTNSKYTSGSRYIGYSGQTETIVNTTALDSTHPWSYYNESEAYGLGDNMYETDYNLVKNSLETVVAKTVGTTTAAYYWIASRYFSRLSDLQWYFEGREISDSGEIHNSAIVRGYITGGVYVAYDNRNTYSKIRPIVTLKAGLTPSGSGTDIDPFVLTD